MGSNPIGKPRRIEKKRWTLTLLGLRRRKGPGWSLCDDAPSLSLTRGLQVN